MLCSATELEAAYGPEITVRVFSDEFTPLRFNALMQTMPASDEINLGLYDLYPFELSNGTPCWIERYAVGDGGELKRGLIAWLAVDGIQMAHLIPGETMTSVELQRDALETIYTFALIQRGAGGGDDIAFNGELGDLGLPDVWPENLPMTLYDTAITALPDEAGTEWSERWGLHVDGEDMLIDIDFSAAPDGGTLIVPKIHGA